jgi:hypothetical protein
MYNFMHENSEYFIVSSVLGTLDVIQREMDDFG